MVDIESIGISKNCCIIQIGACYFDRKTGDIGKTFKININPASCVAAGAKIDAETVYWWIAQSEAARKSILEGPHIDLQKALEDFNLFMVDCKYLWSHATFDFVAIMEAYKSISLKPGFSYKAARDIRTLMDLFNISIDKTAREGVHHDGLADATHQVKYCMEAFRKLEDLKQASGLIAHIRGGKK